MPAAVEIIYANVLRNWREMVSEYCVNNMVFGGGAHVFSYEGPCGLEFCSGCLGLAELVPAAIHKIRLSTLCRAEELDRTLGYPGAGRKWPYLAWG